MDIILLILCNFIPILCKLVNLDIILATFIRPVFVTRAWHSGVLNCHNNNNNNNNNTRQDGR